MAHEKDDGQGKVVGIWIRVSTEDQAKGESPEHHEKRARYYAESKGWIVKEVYHLEAVSGKSVKEHPEAQRMLEDIRKGRITGIIFSKLARLARNTKELLEFADFFREHDADLISLQEAIDTSSPAGRFFYTVIAAMAQWEREEIADRVAASVPIRAKLGKPLGGAAPFGYRWVDRKLIPDPKESPVLKLLFELFQEYKRKKAVARALNEKGYRTRNGSKFSDTTIRRLLEDPTSKGLHPLNHTKSLGEGKRWVSKPKEEWTYLNVEPVLSPELWEACNAVLKEQEKKRVKPTRRPVSIFAGIVRCECGGKMYIPYGSSKYTCQKCRNKLSQSDLEEIFHEQLKSFIISPDEMDKYLAKADKVIKEKGELLDRLLEQEKQIKGQIDELFQLYHEKRITKDDFSERYGPLNDQHEEMKREIPDIQGEIDFLKIQYISGGEVLSEANDLYSGWSKLTDDEKRKIIEVITDSIVVGTDTINIKLAYLPSPNSQQQGNATMSLWELRQPERNMLVHADSDTEVHVEDKRTAARQDRYTRRSPGGEIR